jgi:hypothetical protein
MSLLHAVLPIGLLLLLLSSISTSLQSLRGANDFGDMLPFLLGGSVVSSLGYALREAHRKHWARIEKTVADDGAVNP